jgi:amino acid transporter
MLRQQLFARKSLERLLAEMAGENRLRRVLGPIALTSLGVGAIIGAGIFVTTGETAATKAGPSVMLSYVVAGLGCAFAALCYAEFASMVPVAGSAYTYAYATLGELLAWIIGWDLVLEYAMSCGVIAADWTKYFNEFLTVCFNRRVPAWLSNDPRTLHELTKGATWIGFNLPAVVIMALVTVVLVIGIRQSATTNAILVITKVGVVIFVIAVGWAYVNPAYWTSVPPEERRLVTVSEWLEAHPNIAKLVPRDKWITFDDGNRFLEHKVPLAELVPSPVKEKLGLLVTNSLAEWLKKNSATTKENSEEIKIEEDLFNTPIVPIAALLSPEEREEAKALKSDSTKWGVMSLLGLDRSIQRVDTQTRNPFMPYGVSGILVAAAAVFFAYIGFDAISTHSEEAKRPQRDVPIGILASLLICTVLYFGVSAVITGIEPYPKIDEEAAVAVAFRRLADKHHSLPLKISAALIALGALAGMTSVLLITLLSQARIFLAMARDRLLPPAIFGAVHPRFRTPHLSTMLTGGILCVITAVTPISILFEMVNIGTLLAFIVVCAAVLLLRIRRPEAHRPFRCPAVYVLAPLGVAVNLLMMMFLSLDSWIRLFVWLIIGLVIYFLYGRRHSVLGQQLAQGIVSK